MKINTFKKYNYTANLWTYTVRTEGANQIRTYTYARNIDINVSTSSAGRLHVLFKDTEDDVILGCQLDNVKDENGVELRQNGVYEMGSVDPYVNVWGQIAGFKGIAIYAARDNGA